MQKKLHFPKVFLGIEEPRKRGFLLLCVLRLNFPTRFASGSPRYFSRLFNWLAMARSVGAEHLNAMRKWILSGLETSSIFRSDWEILFSLKPSFPFFFFLHYLVHLLTLQLKTERWKFTLSETAGKTFFNFSSCGICSEELYLTSSEIDQKTGRSVLLSSSTATCIRKATSMPVASS